jgi:hypothetical protein
MTRRIWLGVQSGLAIVVLSTPAAAQATGEPSSSSSQAPIVVEQVRDGFAFAPDVRVTDVNHQTGILAGGYGGWMIDNTLLLGGGGYGLTNGSNKTGLGYGGFVIGWMERSDKAVGYGVRSLFGLGEGSVAGPYTTVLYPPVPPVPTPFDSRTETPREHQVTYLATYHEHFFVVDPQADVIIRLSPKMRLTAGVGYRLIAGTYNIGGQLQGVTGSFSLQIGGSTYRRQ